MPNLSSGKKGTQKLVRATEGGRRRAAPDCGRVTALLRNHPQGMILVW